MNRRAVFIVSLIHLLAVFVVVNAHAQQKSLKEQLVGTWLFSSASDTRSDATAVDRWGPNAKGMLMFDPSGRFMQTITRADLPKFAANRVDQGTAEENKAVMQGLIVLFGTYSLNESDKRLSMKIEGCSFPNLVGGTQTRTIIVLNANELKYMNPMTTTGAKAEVSWNRAP